MYRKTLKTEKSALETNLNPS